MQNCTTHFWCFCALKNLIPFLIFHSGKGFRLCCNLEVVNLSVRVLFVCVVSEDFLFFLYSLFRIRCAVGSNLIFLFHVFVLVGFWFAVIKLTVNVQSSVDGFYLRKRRNMFMLFVIMKTCLPTGFKQLELFNVSLALVC